MPLKGGVDYFKAWILTGFTSLVEPFYSLILAIKEDRLALAATYSGGGDLPPTLMGTLGMSYKPIAPAPTTAATTATTGTNSNSGPGTPVPPVSSVSVPSPSGSLGGTSAPFRPLFNDFGPPSMGYIQAMKPPGSQASQSTYSDLLSVIEEMGKEIRPTYAGSKSAMERLKRGIIHARALVRECLAETERNART
ncbi:cyclin-dependent kinase 2-associated protein 2 isoform X2 [Ambystoma mexicanum]|uniref:cyclin-dependent kinase 2-associated protein 2 isoform X2 n=1 Tax=Ambystoma mexicanum TaxID=8296 RepID=UPI0037E6F851